MNRVYWLGALLWFCVTVQADNPLELRWRGEPLAITIPVGVERVIKFDAQMIQVGVPRSLVGIAHAESNQGIVLLRASRAFDHQRFRFRDKRTGRIVAMDVTARPGGDIQPLTIIDTLSDQTGSHNANPANPASAVEAVISEAPRVADEQRREPEGEHSEEPQRHGYLSLTRYAMQTLYAPKRLLTPLHDVTPINYTDTRYDALVPGASVHASVAGQWRNTDRIVTAVVLQNVGDKPVRLDPRALRGRQHWHTAALMSDVLAPANTYGDTTALVVISAHKWREYQWLR